MPHLVAALSVALNASGTALQVLPAGHFSAFDGRPKEIAGGQWFLDSDTATALIAASARNCDMVIDYEHQTLMAAKNGQPAPASGWIKGCRLEWREGEGLFATEVEWTGRAAAMIDAKEYKYLSPVFTYDKQGRPTKLLHVALTNFPALDNQDEVCLAALSALDPVSTPQPTQESVMDELLEQLRWLLNLPVGTTAEEVKAQLQKLINQVGGEQGTAAAAVDVAALLRTQTEQIAALSANQVDLAKFVPITVMQDLQRQVAALSGQNQGNNLDQVIQSALKDGKLLPAQEQWARDLGGQNMAALSGYLETAVVIPALQGKQTTATPTPSPVPASVDALSPEALAVCKQMGVEPEQYIATLKGETQ